MKFFTVMFLLLLSINSFATTWSKLEVKDPIVKRKKCSVHEPNSYGNYIYQWPSKYDQVF